MKLKDYFLTKESFELVKTANTNILKTYPVPIDIEKYYKSDNYLSHKRKNNLLSNLYSFIQKLNFRYKLKIIKTYTNKKNLLDYGCGSGDFLEFMAKNNYNVVGIEPNLDLNKQFRIYKNIDDIQEKFDIITMWHVLEHIENRDYILKKLKNMLNEDGILFIALPNWKSFDASYYKEYWAGYDVPRHIYHYSKEGAIEYFNSLNLKTLGIKPLYFDSFFVSLLSEKYINKFIGKIRWIIIGFFSNIKALLNNEYSSLIYILSKEN